jgi:hypothetical protein
MSMWQITTNELKCTILSEEAIVIQLVKRLTAFYETQKLFTVST